MTDLVQMQCQSHLIQDTVADQCQVGISEELWSLIPQIPVGNLEKVLVHRQMRLFLRALKGGPMLLAPPIPLRGFLRQQATEKYA